MKTITGFSHHDQAQDKHTCYFHYYLVVVVLANKIREE